jgi:hypothetical protein
MISLATVGPWWAIVLLVLVVGPLLRSIVIIRPRRRDWLRYRHWWDRDGELEAMTDELRARMAQIDSLETRVIELESRLDFAERLLAGPASNRLKSDPTGLPQAAS